MATTISGRDFTVSPVADDVTAVSGNLSISGRDFTGTVVQIGFYNKVDASAAPTANDDSADTSGNGTFSVGSTWVVTSGGDSGKIYRCVDATPTAASWIEITNLEAGDLAGIALNADSANIEGVAANTLLGNNTVSEANAIELSASQVRELLTVDADYQVYNSTTDATQTELFTDGSSTRLDTIPDDSTWAIHACVVARRTDADGESAHYEIKGTLSRDAGTVAIDGIWDLEVHHEDTAAWDVILVADDTNKTVNIEVVGEASKTISWVAKVNLIKVSG